MQFYTDEKRNEYNKLTGANPAKVYVPLNAGRRVGNRKNKDQGSFLTKIPADQVELGAWFQLKQKPIEVVADNSGSFSYTAKQGSANYAINTQAGVATFVLPPAASNVGATITVLRTGTGVNAITVDGYASETINGSANFAGLDAQYDSATFLSDGTEWYIVASNIA